MKKQTDMSNVISCPLCGGKGSFEALVSQHGDEKVTVQCTNCGGKGVINMMSAEQENHYWEDYW